MSEAAFLWLISETKWWFQRETQAVLQTQNSWALPILVLLNFFFIFTVVHLPFCLPGGSWGTFQADAAQDRQQAGVSVHHWALPWHLVPSSSYGVSSGWSQGREALKSHQSTDLVLKPVQTPLHRKKPRVFPWSQCSLSCSESTLTWLLLSCPPTAELKRWGWDGGKGNPTGSIAGCDFLFTPLINVSGVVSGVVTLITCEWQLQQLWEQVQFHQIAKKDRSSTQHKAECIKK